MSDYNAFKTGGSELAVDTPNGQYRFAVETNHDTVLVPPAVMTNDQLRSAIRDCPEVDGLFNHPAIDYIRQP